MTASSFAAPPLLPPARRYFLSSELRASPETTSPEAQALNDILREKILAPDFSCVAAKASVNTSCYALGLYGDLGSPEAAAALGTDLGQFIHDQDTLDSGFTSMIAVFRDAPMSERDFEERLWRQLRALHDLDAQPYSAEVSADPSSERFGFSFGGRGFFVIGLHPGSSRVARTLPFTALVFNAHRQFQALRDADRFGRMQQTIRTRELALQGSLNPNLADYGEASEARQYSGRAVEPDWQAPFPRCPFGHG